MNIKIVNRYTNKIIVEGEFENLKDALEKNKSDLRGSDLSGSDLRGSDLRGCDLRRSDLSGCDLSGCDLRGCDLRESNLSGIKIKVTQVNKIIKSLGIEVG